MIRYAVVFAGLALAGCSMTLPVSGRTADGTEIFTGAATGYMDGGGNLKITSSKGRVCEGNFVYVTARNGSGVFTCDDGKSGPFEFVSTGTRGTGTGVLGTTPFTFTFG